MHLLLEEWTGTKLLYMVLCVGIFVACRWLVATLLSRGVHLFGNKIATGWDQSVNSLRPIAISLQALSRSSYVSC